MGKIKTGQSDAHNLCRTIGQLEMHIINLDNSIKDLKSSFDSIQNRVITVEKQHSFMRGCIGVLLSLGAMIGMALDHALRWFLGK
jgi:hypothetical protein